MSEICCPPPVVERGHGRACRRVLWIALGVDLAMMRSVWLCSRNDRIGNCAVLASAIGVAWSVLTLQGDAVVVTQARSEFAGAAA